MFLKLLKLKQYEKFFSLIAYGRILKPVGHDASNQIDDEESNDQ
jgi:hypothetical protein